MESLTLTVNGEARDIACDPATPLIPANQYCHTENDTADYKATVLLPPGTHSVELFFFR